tara:strand:- start:838 stop:2073 length:1236 start_codon:yes stop_codon:yes gene_type:complete
MKTILNSTEGSYAILQGVANAYPGQTEFKRKHIQPIATALGLGDKHIHPILTDEFRVGHGVYGYGKLLPAVNEDPVITAAAPVAKKVAAVMKMAVPAPAEQVKSSLQSVVNTDKNFGEKDETFVPWGHFKDVKTLVKSGVFFPTYVEGLSGNGKTLMVEQACVAAKREFIRVQMNPESDEDDLLGGFRLIAGETVFAKGPVIKAMETGAVLILDEIDRATNKIMCLQGVLEGKPVLLKKTGEVIVPQPGFNVIATANTKGTGSEDGDSKFTSASILDEAFLERFSVVMHQDYPSAAIEKKIIRNHMAKFGYADEAFTENLAKWADVIRRTYLAGGIDDLISTRRICHIVQTFSIFPSKLKAIELCTNRFGEESRTAFIDLYTKVDAGVLEAEAEAQLTEAADDNDQFPQEY